MKGKSQIWSSMIKVKIREKPGSFLTHNKNNITKLGLLWSALCIFTKLYYTILHVHVNRINLAIIATVCFKIQNYVANIAERVSACILLLSVISRV